MKIDSPDNECVNEWVWGDDEKEEWDEVLSELMKVYHISAAPANSAKYWSVWKSVFN